MKTELKTELIVVKHWPKSTKRQVILLFWIFKTEAAAQHDGIDARMRRTSHRETDCQEYFLLIFGIIKRVDDFWKWCTNREMRVWNGISSESGDHYRRLIDEYDQNGSRELLLHS